MAVTMKCSGRHPSWGPDIPDDDGSQQWFDLMCIKMWHRLVAYAGSELAANSMLGAVSSAIAEAGSPS